MKPGNSVKGPRMIDKQVSGSKNVYTVQSKEMVVYKKSLSHAWYRPQWSV